MARARTSSRSVSGWKRTPPLAGPRERLCWTRYPRRTSSDPSSRRSGTATSSERRGVANSWCSPSSRPRWVTASCSCSSADSKADCTRPPVPGRDRCHALGRGCQTAGRARAVGAGCRDRTDDLLITSELRYRCANPAGVVSLEDAPPPAAAVRRPRTRDGPRSRGEAGTGAVVELVGRTRWRESARLRAPSARSRPDRGRSGRGWTRPSCHCWRRSASGTLRCCPGRCCDPSQPASAR